MKMQFIFLLSSWNISSKFFNHQLISLGVEFFNNKWSYNCSDCSSHFFMQLFANLLFIYYFPAAKNLCNLFSKNMPSQKAICHILSKQFDFFLTCLIVCLGYAGELSSVPVYRWVSAKKNCWSTVTLWLLRGISFRKNIIQR